MNFGIKTGLALYLCFATVQLRGLGKSPSLSEPHT